MSKQKIKTAKLVDRLTTILEGNLAAGDTVLVPSLLLSNVVERLRNQQTELARLNADRFTNIFDVETDLFLDETNDIPLFDNALDERKFWDDFYGLDLPWGKPSLEDFYNRSLPKGEPKPPEDDPGL